MGGNHDGNGELVMRVARPVSGILPNTKQKTKTKKQKNDRTRTRTYSSRKVDHL